MHQAFRKFVHSCGIVAAWLDVEVVILVAIVAPGAVIDLVANVVLDPAASMNPSAFFLVENHFGQKSTTSSLTAGVGTTVRAL